MESIHRGRKGEKEGKGEGREGENRRRKEKKSMINTSPPPHADYY
jgi:hypothetical protein